MTTNEFLIKIKEDKIKLTIRKKLNKKENNKNKLIITKRAGLYTPDTQYTYNSFIGYLFHLMKL